MSYETIDTGRDANICTNICTFSMRLYYHIKILTRPSRTDRATVPAWRAQRGASGVALQH